jgi:hypothetical protein
MEAKLIRERVAQSIRGKAYLNMYECAACGSVMVKSSAAVKSRPRCQDCPSLRSHNMTYHPIYRVWTNMKQRCFNKDAYNYHSYGGRGITVCDEWLDSSKFIVWSLENGWSKGLQIDRIDNSRGYSPDNCRWVKSRTNCRNRRSTKLSPESAESIRAARASGRKLSDIANEFGVSQALVSMVANGRLWGGVTELESASRSPQGG